MSCTENRSVKRLITRQILEELSKEMAHLSFLRVFVSDFLTSKILYIYIYIHIYIHTHVYIYELHIPVTSVSFRIYIYILEFICILRIKFFKSQLCRS